MLEYGVQLFSFLAILFSAWDDDLPKIIDELKASKKKILKKVRLIVVLLFKVMASIWVAFFLILPYTEEFSVSNKNITFETLSENIVLHPSKQVIEDMSLSVKDSFTYIQPHTHYIVRKDTNTIFLNFIGGDNKESNRALASRGLIYRYKTRFSLLDPPWKRQ